MTLTPHHRVLTKLGTFIEAEKLIQPDGSVELVLKDGSVMPIKENKTCQATRIAYSADTAALYEEAAEVVAASHGALALKPQMQPGWRRLAKASLLTLIPALAACASPVLTFRVIEGNLRGGECV